MPNNHNNSEDELHSQPKKTVDESSFNISQPKETVDEFNLGSSNPKETMVESATNNNLRPSFARENSLEGKTIGDNNRYLLQGLLGQGGMSKVYRALDTKFEDRVVAVKIMTNYSAVSDRHLIKRFMGEVKSISRLKHPNIIQVFDYGITPNTSPFFSAPFYVMEYFAGKTLQTLLTKEKVVALHSLLKIIRQVCTGLEEAHKKGIVHRDLKPDNIFLVSGGAFGEVVKIIDFGIAKNIGIDRTNYTQLTQQGSFIGTYRYASPEQCRGLPNIDQRTDIYSLGIILYEAISGKSPYNLDDYSSTTQADWIACHIRVSPNPLKEQPGCENISDDLNAIVMKCLAKKPEARFSNIGELQASLAKISLTNNKKNPIASETEPIRKESKQTVPEKKLANTFSEPVSNNTGINNNQFKKPVALIASIVFVLIGAVGIGVYWVLDRVPKVSIDKNELPKPSESKNHNQVAIDEPDLSLIVEALDNEYQQKNYQKCYDLAAQDTNRDNKIIQEWIGKCGLATAKIKAEANSFTGAIAIAQKIPDTVPNYSEIENNINLWSEKILNYATKVYRENSLEEAIKITQIIPDNSKVKATIPDLISQWKQETEKHQSIINNAQNLLNQGQWSSAKQEVEKIPASFVVWRKKGQPILDKANEQINAIAAEKRRKEQAAAAEKRRIEQAAAEKRRIEQAAAEKRRREQAAAARLQRDRQTLNRATALANRGNYQQAIATAQTISRGSAIYSQARDKINYWNKKLHEKPLRPL